MKAPDCERCAWKEQQAMRQIPRAGEEFPEVVAWCADCGAYVENPHHPTVLIPTDGQPRVQAAIRKQREKMKR